MAVFAFERARAVEGSEAAIATAGCCARRRRPGAGAAGAGLAGLVRGGAGRDSGPAGENVLPGAPERHDRPSRSRQMRSVERKGSANDR